MTHKDNTQGAEPKSGADTPPDTESREAGSP
jgi:hypothetical protein